MKSKAVMTIQNCIASNPYYSKDDKIKLLESYEKMQEVSLDECIKKAEEVSYEVIAERFKEVKQGFVALFLWVIADKLGFGEKRLKEIGKEYISLVNAIDSDYATVGINTFEKAIYELGVRRIDIEQWFKEFELDQVKTDENE